MTTMILHYFHDPLCGWCYGAEPLVQAAAADGTPVKLHGGGLWDLKAPLSSSSRNMIRVNDRRIHVLTGQPFGEEYLDGLLGDPTAVFHSRPTIAAILTAELIDAGNALPMLNVMQRAHYLHGRRIVERETLVELAGEIGVDTGAFAAALDDVAVDAHIAATQQHMRRHALHGYPSFLLEVDGVFSRLSHDECYGHPEAFAAKLTSPARHESRANRG